MATEAKKVVSLKDYISQKRRSECPVCSLPEDIRKQVIDGRRKQGYDLNEIIEWLKVQGIDVTRQNFTTHTNGHHDDRAA